MRTTKRRARRGRSSRTRRGATQSNAAAPAVPAPWVNIKAENHDGDSIAKRIPAGAVSALVRCGMVVHPEGGSKLAVVVHVLPDFCVVQYEDGSTDALRWGEVSIEHAIPDLSEGQALSRCRLWDRLNAIAEHVYAKLKPTDPLVVAFHRALDPLDECVDYNGVIPRDQLHRMRAARNMFFALPVKRQREICNGWTPDPFIPERCELPEEDTLQQLLCIHTGVDSKDCDVSACQKWSVDDSLNQVEVQIAFGTTKQQAVTAIDRIRKMIANRWPELIRDDNTMHHADPRKDWTPEREPKKLEFV